MPFNKLRVPHSTDGFIVRRVGRDKAADCNSSRKGEQGYLLLMVVVLAALVLIALALAAPKMKARIQRDQEQELRYRGMAYAHAIKLYYHKFNNYPTTINQMVNSNNIKFLRKKYSDPITGLKVWRPVYFGQVGWGGSTNPNCSTSASSFGGSPGGSSSALGGSPSSSFGSPSGGLGQSNSPSSGLGSSSSTAGCPTTTGDASNSASNGASGTLGGATNPDGTPATPAAPALNALGLPVGTDPANVPDPAGFLTPITSFGQTATGGGFSTGSSGSSNTSSLFSGGAAGVAGAGGPIVGVASLSRKESIMSVKGKNHYNDLEFVYDPTQDYGGTAGLTGTSIGASQQLSPTNNSQPPGFGSGFGSTPSTPTPPTQPTQPSNPTPSQ